MSISPPGRSFWFVLAGFLTGTLGLCFAVLTSFSPGDVPNVTSDRELNRTRIAVLGLGLAGLAVTAALLALGRHRSRRSLVGLIGIGVAMAVSATLLATLLPGPSAIRPVGPKPLAMLGIAVGLLAWASALATHRWRSAQRDGEEPAAIGFWWRLLAFVLAVGIAVGAGAGAFALRTAYRNSADEFLEPGDRTPARAAVVSRLDGTVAWRAEASLPEAGGVYALRTSPYGLGLSTDSDIVSLDSTTGALRWRYFRSDLDSYTPHALAVEGGRKFLIDWTSENAGYLVLDADTGNRVSTWPSTYADDDLQAVLDDGALLGHHVGKGSDSIVRVGLDGHEQWRFEPGAGKDLVADATASVAVIDQHDSRNDPADQLIGLDLASGTQLWAVPQKVQPLLTTGETYVVGNAGDNQISELHGIDARTGRTSWTQPLRPATATSCSTRYVEAGSAMLQAVCFGNDGQNPTVVRMRTDGTDVQRQTLTGRWLEDVTLTEDGRTVVLARDREDSYSTPAMYVSAGGTASGTESGTGSGTGSGTDSGWRKVVLPESVDPRGFNVLAVGNQVLLTQGGAIYALN